MLNWLVAKLGVWIVLAIVGAIVVGGFNLLAKSGGLIRLGVETRKALANAQTEMAQQGAVPNEKFYATNRSAMLKIILPIVGWIVLYAVIFFAATLPIFLGSFLLLVAPAMGYNGYKLTRG